MKRPPQPEHRPPLDQAIDQVVANPGETFDFHREGKVVAVIVSADYLEELRRKVGA